MKYQLSFATINILSDCILEIIINEGVEVSIEMLEEFDEFLAIHFVNKFSLLINKINNYSFTFESKMMIASNENLHSIAVITYNHDSRKAVEDLHLMRAVDGWNLRIFSGLELGWQQGVEWLNNELKTLSNK